MNSLRLPKPFNPFKIQSDEREPLCICGSKLRLKAASTCYRFRDAIYCVECGERVYGNNMVYNCPQQQCKEHSYGFDLCIPCGKIKGAQSLDNPSRFLIIPNALL